jgi:MFS family permease
MESPLRLGGTFRALRHKNFRNFFIGQAISVIGTWMQTTALGWLVWRLTYSEEMLGFFNFIGRIPAIIVTPLAGVLADRYSRHKMVLWAQILQMAQALALASLTLAGIEHLGVLGTLAFMLGIFSAIDIPARQSFLIQLVGREDLANAIPLNSGAFNLARVLGPVVAGALVALFARYELLHPEGVCFLINGLSYIIVIGALVRMKLAPPTFKRQSGSVGQNLAQAWRFVMEHEAVLLVLLYMAVVSMFGYAHSVILPAMTSEVLGKQAGGFGILLGASGLGALFGAIFLARRADLKGVGYGKVIASSGLVLGVALVLFSISKNFWLSAGLLVPAGAGMMVQSAATNTLLQQVTPDHLRGRIISFFSLFFVGIFPIGGLLLGWIAGAAGSPTAMLLGGGVCAIGALMLILRLPQFRESVERLTKLIEDSEGGSTTPEQPKE